MTDKQIIIDGVDVSGCPYYIDSEGSCSSQDCECIKCIHNVCFYKDYKAKEQECEELKEELHQNFKEKDGLHLIIDRLLEASGYDTNTASAEDFEDVYENMRYEKQQLYQLKQTLQEIKEIAEECYYECNSMNNCNISCKYYNDCNGEFSYLLAYLNKQISEVENDNK